MLFFGYAHQRIGVHACQGPPVWKRRGSFWLRSRLSPVNAPTRGPLGLGGDVQRARSAIEIPFKWFYLYGLWPSENLRSDIVLAQKDIVLQPRGRAPLESTANGAS